ncbi:MAG: 6-phosphogluconolactonase [Thiohalomonadaceae bacterium]
MSMNENSIPIHISTDPAALYQAAAERLLELGNHAIAERGSFHLALAGGSTPRGLYALLSQQAERIDWTRVQLYFGDERCVSPEHQDSNYRMVRDSLLDHLPIQPQIHRMRGELPPSEAAAYYAKVLAQHLPATGFDLVLLGLGTDGHIASLFPGSNSLHEQQQTVLADFVGKMDSWRLSLTLPVLNQARHIMLLVSGVQKARVISQVLNSNPTEHLFPVQRLKPRGTLEWFIDEPAASLLDNGHA